MTLMTLMTDWEPQYGWVSSSLV